MAERRMFTKKVTDDDRFMNLSASAQALYLHLCMGADDDGFCNQVAVSMFKAHASVQDLEALLSARYLLQFDTGVIVIKHWRMANALRKDRYTPTTFQEELAKLQLKENGAYTERLPDGCQTVAACLPQDSIGKDRLGKDRLESGAKAPRSRFTKPTVDEVAAYCNERKNGIDPKHFVDYYEARGWKVGNCPMKNWQAAVRTWEARNGTTAQAAPEKPVDIREYQDIFDRI